MNATETLRLQQRRLQQAILAAAPAEGVLRQPAEGVLRTRADGRPALLHIYRHAFRARLVAALADNHTVLQRALGDEAFEALGRAYVQACPSTHPSIRWYGDRLAEFMATREDLVAHPALVDLARMDWALRDAFDAADAPVLELAALAAVPPEDWGALRFVAHPSVRTLTLAWAVEAAWRALREHDPATGEPEPALPAPQAHAHVLLVWRRGLETQWRSLPALEAGLLQAALAGQPYAALCEQAAAALDGDASRAAAAAAGALQQWLADGLFSMLRC
ncbi:MAG: DNA-binding domain-containing protein [Pseudomonadota bacterium]